MGNHTLDRLREVKQALGPLTFLDGSQFDTVAAHRQLGQSVSAQAQKILAQRLNEVGDMAQVATQIRRARAYHLALEKRLQNPSLDEAIKAAVRVYMSSLSAWAEGAQLDAFRQPFLPTEVDGLPVSAADLAMFLQEDEVGCQTGAYRELDGSVIFWHVEEDDQPPGARFDQLRLFTFQAHHGQLATAFVYPDLLPGPTLAWRNDSFVQAVDTLHIRFAELTDPLLPNTLAWLSLYLGGQFSREHLARNLGPFQGGYSLTALGKRNGQVNVEKIEFANDAVSASQLGDAPGCYLSQTNILRDPTLPIGLHENASAESRAWNGARYACTDRWLQVVRRSADPLRVIFRMLQSRLGGESAYANEVVKAYLVCQMSSAQTSLWVGTGAALAEAELHEWHWR